MLLSLEICDSRNGGQLFPRGFDSTMDIFVGFGMIIVAHLKQSIYFAQINFLEKKFQFHF